MLKKPAKVRKEKNDKKEKWDVAQLKTVGSPVDISLPQCTEHLCAPLELQYYDAMPISLEMINTGSTGWTTFRLNYKNNNNVCASTRGTYRQYFSVYGTRINNFVGYLLFGMVTSIG